MAFEVPPLPYDYGALEPTIDEETMRLHHDKHHQAYVDNANKALAGTELADSPVEHVLAVYDTLPEDIQATVRNNAGGHANHSLFWETMGPDGGRCAEADGGESDATGSEEGLASWLAEPPQAGKASSPAASPTSNQRGAFMYL